MVVVGPSFAFVLTARGTDEIFLPFTAWFWLVDSCAVLINCLDYVFCYDVGLNCVWINYGLLSCVFLQRNSLWQSSFVLISSLWFITVWYKINHRCDRMEALIAYESVSIHACKLKWTFHRVNCVVGYWDFLILVWQLYLIEWFPKMLC